MQLMMERMATVMKKVNAVIQVVGSDLVPLVPKGEDEMREWYLSNSFVAVPSDHDVVVERKMRKRHGAIKTFDEGKAVKLLSEALPDIKLFVDSRLNNNAPSATIYGEVNGVQQ